MNNAFMKKKKAEKKTNSFFFLIIPISYKRFVFSIQFTYQKWVRWFVSKTTCAWHKEKMQGCLWCVYGCQRCISQPFSFISLPVSTVNALVNDKIRSFKAAFDLWWVQCNKIKSGVFRNFVLSKCFSVRLPRCFEKHPARHERNMKRKKKKRRLTIVDQDFVVERPVIL